jgi:signal transduction histidine kinase
LRTLRGKLIFLLIISTLTPLIIYGALSLINAQRVLKETIQQNYGEINSRASSQIKLYIENAQDILGTLVEDLANTNLTEEQSQRIVDNYVIRFPQFQKILLYKPGGNLLYTTALAEKEKDTPGAALVAKTEEGTANFSNPYLSEDLTPVIWYLLPMKTGSQTLGVLAAQLDLMQMWEWVSSTRLGKSGYVSVVDKNGSVVASGDPFYKRAILSSEQPVYLESFNPLEVTSYPQVRHTKRGDFLMSVALILNSPPWYLVLAQPAREAFSVLRTMRWELLGLIAFTLIFMLLAATWGSRRALLRPVKQLLQATVALGRGDLKYRIPPLGQDELGQLGISFNKMIEDLGNLQEMTRRQERLAMFGRIASGLAHDLKHPVKNIESAAKVMETMYQDESYRQTFTRIVKREFERINRFLDDLRNLTHEMPYHPVSFNLRKLFEEVLESAQAEAQKKGAHLDLVYKPEDPTVTGDPFLLRRVFENLVSNALQALPPQGGKLFLGVQRDSGVIKVEVRDTGEGIAPEKLPGLFEEFVTTKRKGLGLGLAITKKILQLHGGDIAVESTLGQGTTFMLHWPLASDKKFP